MLKNACLMTAAEKNRGGQHEGAEAYMRSNTRGLAGRGKCVCACRMGEVGGWGGFDVWCVRAWMHVCVVQEQGWRVW